MAHKATPETLDPSAEEQETTGAANQATETAEPEADTALVSIPPPANNAPLSGILTAIAGATAAVKRLAKANDNNEQKYKYSSIDDFLAMTGPICAAHGLVIIQQEIGLIHRQKAGKYGPKDVVEFAYEFTLYHSATGQSLPPIRRTVEVYNTGAQSSGSAQSYAQKTFLRGLLQIPTGDTEDPDAGHNDQPSKREQQQPQQEQRQHRRSDNWQHPQGQQQQPTQQTQQKPKRTAEDLARELIAGITTAKTLAELEGMNTAGQPLYERWGWLEDNGKQAAADLVQQAYAEHRNKLTLPEPQQPAQRHNDLDDEIPY